MPEIRPVTKDNWLELARLKVSKNQENFVAPNVYSIAQMQFGADDEIGRWTLTSLGVYEHEKPVGYVLYGLNYDQPETQGLIMRLMVDENHQGKGLGRFAMQAVLDIFRADEKVRKVVISYDPENAGAKQLYASLGFVETGEIFHGEIVAVLNLIDQAEL